MRRTDAFETIARALETNQIGTVVSLRIIAQIADDPSEIERASAVALEQALRWLDDSASSVSAMGDPHQHLSLLLRSSKGFTGLISAGLCTGEAATVEVVVFGTRGMLSWEGDGGLSLLRADDSEQIAPAADETLALIASAVAKLASLRAAEAARSSSSLLDEKLPTPAKHSPPHGLLLVSGYYTHQPG